MADNTTITAGTGTTIAADDIGAGVLAQRVKPVWGPDGTGNDVDVASGKAMPVQVRSATGLIPIGEPTDAANSATDTTSVSAISIWKQISLKITAAAASLVTVATNSGNALSAGIAIIGKVGIDQNTDGTTNAVRLLAETTKVIGTVNVSANQNITPVDQYSNYFPAPASATTLMGATGAVGDYLAGVIIIPGAAAAGTVGVTDGNGSTISLFAGGGTTALPSLVPFFVPFGIAAKNATTAGWRLICGANVTAIGVGKFT